MLEKNYLKTKDQCKVKFIFNDDNAKKVELLGLHNDWDHPIVMSKKKDGAFIAEVSLPKNSFQEFKYRVNGNEWVNDPEADGEAPNGFGSTNSIVQL